MRVRELIRDLTCSLDYTKVLTDNSYDREFVRSILDRNEVLRILDSDTTYYNIDTEMCKILSDYSYGTSVSDIVLVYKNLYYILCNLNKHILGKYSKYNQIEGITEIDYSGLLLEMVERRLNKEVELPDSVIVEPIHHSSNNCANYRLLVGYYNTLAVNHPKGVITYRNALTYKLLDKPNFLVHRIYLEEFFKIILDLPSSQEFTNNVGKLVTKDYSTLADYLLSVKELYDQYR